MFVIHNEHKERHERMSRQELLEEITRLQFDLATERQLRAGLEALMEAEGFVIMRDDQSKHTVAERRPYRNGYLTNEYRRNKKTGKLTGPYWQYRAWRKASR